MSNRLPENVGYTRPELRVLNDKWIIIKIKEMNENPCLIKLGQNKL